jgi:chemotaxis protein MotB
MPRRRRKQSQEEHVNLERWLVSYADFITLLFAFFVVMYAISSVNEGKYRGAFRFFK